MERELGVLLERPYTLEELCERHGGIVPAALRSRLVDRVVSPRHAARATDLVVVTSPRFVSLASEGPGILLVDAALGARLAPERAWVHAHVWWAIARIVPPEVEEFPSAAKSDNSPAISPRIHPRAVVAENARVAPSAILRAGAVVRAGASVGERTDIGENAVLYGGARIGSDCCIGPGAIIGRPGFGFARGPGGEVVRIPHRGGVLIEDGVEVGALCTVDAGTLSPTIVGQGSKLDAHVHVGHNVEIGRGVWVAAQSGFAGSSVVGDGVQVGGQSGFADHVEVGRGAKIAAKSGVIGDIAEGSVVAGFPAVDRVRWLRSMAVLLKRARPGEGAK